MTGIDDRHGHHRRRERSRPAPSSGAPATRRRRWQRCSVRRPTERGASIVERRSVDRRCSNIFAIGDIAHARSDGSDVPGVAQGAIQGGAHVARVIRADLDGTSPADLPLPEQGGAGHDRTVVRGRHHRPTPIVGLDRVDGVVVRPHLLPDRLPQRGSPCSSSWAWNYLTFARGSRLITQPWKPSSPTGNHRCKRQARSVTRGRRPLTPSGRGSCRSRTSGGRLRRRRRGCARTVRTVDDHPRRAGSRC